MTIIILIWLNNFFMYSHQLNNEQLTEQICKDRTSNKTCTSNSELQEYSPLTPPHIPLPLEPFRLELFETPIETIQISQKVNQRAVSWMITICWSKSFSQECLWSTLLLYYSCKARSMIKKQDLQLTLLSCLSLSIKMTTFKGLSPRELASLSSKQILAADIINMQKTILQLVDYNIVIPHQLCDIIRSTAFSQDQIQQILLICQLLMIKDYDIFLNRAKLENIVRMLGGEEMQKYIKDTLHSEIKHLLQLKQCKIILNKYSSKFDTQIFTHRFL